jgi:hypothetical protein
MLRLYLSNPAQRRFVSESVSKVISQLDSSIGPTAPIGLINGT